MEKMNKKQAKKSVKKVKTLKLPPLDSEEVKTIVDIDPEYYSIVKGRPIRANKSFNTYKQNIRKVALNKTVYGFLTEEMLRIDKEIMTENNIYESAAKHFEECKISFDKFLAHDNGKTIEVMKKSDALNKNLTMKTEEHRKAHYEMASLKSKLLYIDETLQILLEFENFLHKVSPHLWQKSQNIDLTKTQEEIFNMDSNIFKKLDTDLIKTKLENLPPTRLYFEKPEQLLEIFHLLEEQNLNCLLITEETSSIKGKFLKARDKYKENLKYELNFIEDKIEEIKDVIKWQEAKEIESKAEFFKILEEKIRFLVSSEMALQVHTYVEYAYENVIAPNDTNQSTKNMMLGLENEYNNLMLGLTEYDLSLVKEIEQQTFEKAAKEIKEAKEAHKMLKNVDKISKRLNAAFKPKAKNNTV